MNSYEEELTEIHDKMFKKLKDLDEEQLAFITYFSSLAINNSLATLLQKYDKELPKDFMEEATKELKEQMLTMKCVGLDILNGKRGNKA